MRTFSRDHWNEAQQAWKDGDYSDEWKPYRHQAAMRGMLYPPIGTKWDSWEDDDPSDRAMLIRAIRETPSLVQSAISRAHSWPEVVAYIVRRRDQWRDELAERERDEKRRVVDDTPRSSLVAIGGIFEKVAESVGYVRE